MRGKLHTEDPQVWTDLWNLTVNWRFLLGACKLTHLLHGYEMGGEYNNYSGNIWRQEYNTVVRDLHTPDYYGVHNTPSPARNFTYMNPTYILTPDLRTSLILLSHLLQCLHRSFLHLRFQDFMHLIQFQVPISSSSCCQANKNSRKTWTFLGSCYVLVAYCKLLRTQGDCKYTP
jgi:hypothetical protein